MEAREPTAPAALPWWPLLPWQEGFAQDMLSHRQSWPHALLIHGPAGFGKHALALNLAQGLLCESPRPDGLACGRCPSCGYAVAGAHPDLMRLEQAMIDEDDGALTSVDSIAVERVRALTRFILLTSHRLRAKVGVIAPAERMNAAAANALLKTLEEPPPGCYLILVSHQPGRLPATIRSRCRQMPAPRPTKEGASAWLAAQGVSNGEVALAQAGGAPLAALAHADAAWQTERDAWLKALAVPERLSVIALAGRIDAGARDERRDRLARAVDWLCGWVADLAREQAGQRARMNPDFVEPLQSLGRRVAPMALFRYHRTLMRERALLAHPLTPRLVAEALLIEYRGLFR